MHKDSGYFISAMKECSQTRKIGYGAELSYWYSEQMIFKILPKFKSREMGDLIQAKESVLIQNSYNSCFINFIEGVEPYFNDLGDVIPNNINLGNTGSYRKSISAGKGFGSRGGIGISRSPKASPSKHLGEDKFDLTAVKGEENSQELANKNQNSTQRSGITSARQ